MKFFFLREVNFLSNVLETAEVLTQEKQGERERVHVWAEKAHNFLSITSGVHKNTSGEGGPEMTPKGVEDDREK